MSGVLLFVKLISGYKDENIISFYQVIHNKLLSTQ